MGRMTWLNRTFSFDKGASWHLVWKYLSLEVLILEPEPRLQGSYPC